MNVPRYLVLSLAISFLAWCLIPPSFGGVGSFPTHAFWECGRRGVPPPSPRFLVLLKLAIVSAQIRPAKGLRGKVAQTNDLGEIFWGWREALAGRWARNHRSNHLLRVTIGGCLVATALPRLFIRECRRRDGNALGRRSRERVIRRSTVVSADVYPQGSAQPTNEERVGNQHTRKEVGQWWSVVGNSRALAPAFCSRS